MKELEQRLSDALYAVGYAAGSLQKAHQDLIGVIRELVQHVDSLETDLDFQGIVAQLSDMKGESTDGT